MLVFAIDLACDMELKVNCPKYHEPYAYLQKLCKEGASARWTEITEGVQQRLDYELENIHKKDLDSFFDIEGFSSVCEIKGNICWTGKRIIAIKCSSVFSWDYRC